jgi:hypothetical protein
MIYAINDTNQSTNELTNGSVLNYILNTRHYSQYVNIRIFTYCVIVC